MQVTQVTATATMHFQQGDNRAKNVTLEPKLGHTTQIIWPFLIQVPNNLHFFVST